MRAMLIGLLVFGVGGCGGDSVGDPIENSIGMVLVPIPAGEFMMGSRVSAVELAKRFDTSADYFEDQPPRHPVTLTKPFYLGATEVTQAQWKAVLVTTIRRRT